MTRIFIGYFIGYFIGHFELFFSIFAFSANETQNDSIGKGVFWKENGS